MASQVSLRGVFPPLTTPFVNGEVSAQKLRENVEKYNKSGVRGYVILGSNGEYVHLSEKEKLLCVETVCAAAGEKMTRIVGSGCETTEETIRFTKAAASLGAQAALVVTPHYYRGRMDTPTLVEHFTRVAEASPIPVLIYNVPGNTGINIDPAVPIKASEHPNIIGMKNSSGILAEMAETLAEARPGFQLLAGSGGFFLPALSIGAVGCVPALGNVAPRECVAIYDLWNARKLDEARAMQLRVVTLNRTVTARWSVPAVKAGMDMVGYYGGEPRRPLLPLGEKEQAELRKIMVKAGVLEG